MRTIVVNLFAGPGAGKSTLAAGVFHRLKLEGINCELVTEYAKDLTWEGRTDLLQRNQVLVLGEQYERLSRLVGKVDVIVTDSPLLMSKVYSLQLNALDALVDELWGQFDNINFVVTRTKPYNPVGRNQSLPEALLLDGHITDMLDACGAAYESVCCDQVDIVARDAKLRMMANSKGFTG